MNISQRIASLESERAVALRAYEVSLQSAMSEERDLNETEIAAVGDTRNEIDRLDAQLRIWQQAETDLAANAVPARGGLPAVRPPSVPARPIDRSPPRFERREHYRCQDFTRLAIAVSVAGHSGAAEYARMRWGDEDPDFAEVCELNYRRWVTRAPVPPIAGNDGGGGGANLLRLVHLGSEFIEMLRPELIVGRLPNLRMLSFNDAGSMEIPRQTNGVNGGYVGEGQAIQVNRLDFGRLLLVPAKLGVIVPATNEILRRSDPGLEQIIRDDLLQGTARTIDRAFFRIGTAPSGPAGILEGITPLAGGAIPPATGQGDVAAATASLGAMIQALEMADVPMNSMVWVMPTRTRGYLRLLRTDQTEIFAFKAEIDAGTLLGFPIIASNNILLQTGGTAPQLPYALMDCSQIIWADDMAPFIDASSEASVQLDNAPPPPAATSVIWSAFQHDMMLLRLRTSHTWARRHDVAIVWAHTSV